MFVSFGLVQHFVRIEGLIMHQAQCGWLPVVSYNMLSKSSRTSRCSLDLQQV